MKKSIISVITTISMLFTGAINVKAETTLEEKYKQAYDQTMSVVTIAQQYGVKPFYREGESLRLDVVNAVDKGDLQKEILSARQAIDLLPSNIQLAKNTLSSILDEYQHPIYKSIVDVVNDANESLVDQLINVDEKSDFIYEINENKILVVDGVVVSKFYWGSLINKRINSGKKLIKDVPEPFKSTYSLALDEQKQKILSWYVNLVTVTEKTKNESLKFEILKMLEEERYMSINGPEVSEFINILINRVNNVVAKSTLTKKDIIKYALEEGFIEVNNFSKLPSGLDKLEEEQGIKQIFTKTEGVNELACIVWDNNIEIYSKQKNLEGAIVFIGKVLQKEVGKAMVAIENNYNKEFITANGIMCKCTYDYKYNYNSVMFKVFK